MKPADKTNTALEVEIRVLHAAASRRANIALVVALVSMGMAAIGLWLAAPL